MWWWQHRVIQTKWVRLFCTSYCEGVNCNNQCGWRQGMKMQKLLSRPNGNVLSITYLLLLDNICLTKIVLIINNQKKKKNYVILLYLYSNNNIKKRSLNPTRTVHGTLGSTLQSGTLYGTLGSTLQSGTLCFLYQHFQISDPQWAFMLSYYLPF